MTTIKSGTKRTSLALLLLIGLISIALVSAVWVRTSERYVVASLQAEAIVLQVPTLAQSQGTSCGEAAIVMAYYYAYPQSPLNEADVIAYAAEKDILPSRPSRSPARRTW